MSNGEGSQATPRGEPIAWAVLDEGSEELLATVLLKPEAPVPGVIYEPLYYAVSETSTREWQPIASAPKDGTLVLLLIGADDARENPLEDTAAGSRTIGQNNFENDGEDVWQLAGWCWAHDHYTEGHGAPTHWQPLPEAPHA